MTNKEKCIKCGFGTIHKLPRAEWPCLTCADNYMFYPALEGKYPHYFINGIIPKKGSSEYNKLIQQRRENK